MRPYLLMIGALVVLALLYNALPLASTPAVHEVTWRGEVGARSVAAQLQPDHEGERLIVTGLSGAAGLTATWLPVEGQGVIVERALDIQGDEGRSGLLALTADRWQLLLKLDEGSGTSHLAAVDWERGADGVLRPVDAEPSPNARLIGWVNTVGPVALIVTAAAVGLIGVLRIVRARPTVESF